MTPGKAHQRLIKERMAKLPEPDISKKKELASSLANAEVMEIDHKTASEVILQYEWLGNAGASEYRFGLYFGHHLAGVVCFGRTAGSNVAASVCGEENAHVVITLSRGACVHWAHPHSASFLINKACKLMVEKGFNVFVAYSDTDAGEVGTVYQASNWLCCGRTNESEQFRWTGEPIKDDNGRVWKNGEWHDSRLISAYTRNRQNRNVLRKLRSQGKTQYRGKKIKGSGRNIYLENEPRAELRARMIEEGFEFGKGNAKFRYVHFAGDRRIVRRLRKALRWQPEAYPKRQGGLVEGNAVSTTDGDGVRSPETAPIPSRTPRSACRRGRSRLDAIALASLGESARQGRTQRAGRIGKSLRRQLMKGPMKLIDARSGLMECRVCGSRHVASLQSGHDRADGVTRFHRGSYQCSNEQCPSNQREWDEKKKRCVKPDWRKLVEAATV